MESPEELQSVIRSLLVSDPTITKANKLFRDYESSEGTPFPFRQLGFDSFVDYLKSIPTVVRIAQPNSFNPEVYPIISSEVSHINKLVSKQRLPPSKSTGRRGWGLTRPPPRRRPTIINPSPPTRLNTVPQQSRLPPNKGVYVSEIEDHLRNNYSREQLSTHGVYSANDVLKYATNMVDYSNGKVYPQMSATSNLISSPSQDPGASKYGPPAESDHEDDNEYDDYDESEYFQNLSEEEISNYTIQRYTQSNPEPQENIKSPTREFEEYQQEDYHESYDSHGSNISKGMINNFRKILSKHPDGIWCRDLPAKYFEEFGVPLDLLELGYNSAITLVSSLPHVFVYKRLGFSKKDWKLYDARIVKESDTSESPGHYNSEIYVPQAIFENIKKLSEIYKNGFRSTALQQLYEVHFKKVLDWKTLGFKQLEDFLEVLKDIVTIRKVTNYYLVLPKVAVVPLQEAETFEEFELQKEAMPFLGPDNIVLPGERIPNQELPDVKKDAKGHDPLMELEMRVSEIFTPHLFHIMLDSTYIALESMMEDLHKFYEQEQEQYHISVPYIQPGLFCVCKYDGLWHRARVISKKEQIVKIEYIDYGTPQTVECSRLRYLHSDFAELPAQAITAKLIGIEPCTGEIWPSEVSSTFLDMVAGKRLLAHIYGFSLKKTKHKFEETVLLEMIIYDTLGSKEIVVNDWLVENGLAKPIGQRKTASAIQLEEHDFNSSTPPNHASHQAPEKNKKDEEPKKRSVLENINIDLLVRELQEEKQKKQPELPRQLPKIPPGFEKQLHELPPGPSNSGFPVNSLYNAQVNVNSLLSAYRPPQLQPQQYYNFLQQYPMYGQLMPSHQTPNIPPMNNMYNSHLYPYPNVQYPPPNPHLFPPPNPYPYGVQPNYGMYYPQQQFPHLQPKVEVNYNSVNIAPQNNQYSRGRQAQVSSNTTGQSFGLSQSQLGCDSDTSSKLQVNILQQQTISQQNPSLTGPLKNTIKDQDHDKPATILNSQIDATSTKTVCELKKDIQISRPTTPSTPSFPEVKSIWDYHEYNNEKSSLSSHSEKNSRFELNNETKDERVSNDTCIENSITSNLQSNLNIRCISSTSDDNASALESTDDTNYVSKSHVQESSTHGETVKNDAIPDSWEEIDTDDTPRKADYYQGEIFKKTFDILTADNNIESISKLPTETDYISYNNNNILNTEKTQVKDPVLITEKINPPVNWKDVFNPDVISISKCSKETNDKSICMDKIIVKKTLVQKLEIDKKGFHLIYVQNKLAVLAQEFYSQFTPMNWSTISKLLEVKYQPLPVIHKTKEPALFSELNKVEFCGGVNNKTVLKLGKTTISYLSDIPAVLGVLRINDKVLLEELKRIKNNFDSS